MRTRKTARAIATVNGNLAATPGTIEYAKRADRAWFCRTTLHTRDGSETTRWAPCASPEGALGVAAPTDDSAFHVRGERITDEGLLFSLFVCGDIGHRLRLPAD